jgi:seryl-tRNA synthetase
MLDIQLIRTDRDGVAAALTKRMDADEVQRALDEVLALDARRRALMQEVETAHAARNQRAKENATRVRGGEAPLPVTGLPDPAEREARLREVDASLDEAMSALPNMPADDVVARQEANRVVRTHGEQPSLASPLPHWDVATKLGRLVDFRRGAILSGSGFWIYRGLGAQLEWALLDYFIGENLKAGYTMTLPPHLVLPAAGRAAGQFPKFVDDVYHTNDPSGLFLIPTSETAIAGMYAGEISQFTPPEQSQQALDEMVAHVEGLVAKLGLHFQTVLLAAKDASASMRGTFDIEVWMPSMGLFKEVSSVSWAGDYQARRANIRQRAPGGKGTQFVHTLNGSALATSRIFPAILEHYQQPDGSVLVPDVLRPYTFGVGARALN